MDKRENDKWMKELKGVPEKEHGREFLPEEVEKVADFMKMMAEMSVGIFLEDKRRQELLTQSPDGFAMDRDGYSCTICGEGAFGKGAWFDRHGLKCGVCQGSVNRGEIPPDLGMDREAWYTSYELESYFNLTAPVLKQWLKKRILNMRTITREGKGIHRKLFLISENGKMLPPKDLLKSGTVKEIIDGEEWHCSRPWYWFVDPQVHLKGYKILEYLRFERLDPKTF